MSVSPYSSQYRTWVTCGAYAMLHALQANDIDLLELENSTGVTFGIASWGAEHHCTRMLTPFRTFWEGMVSATRLWGIKLQLTAFNDVSELCYFLVKAPPSTRLVLGPVSMAGLRYLPLSSQYRCADHYIALRKDHLCRLFLTDSEGVTEMQVTAQDLAGMCMVEGIPEAKQMYTVGVVIHDGPVEPLASRLKYTIQTAGENLQAAEYAGQGSNAILRCLCTMKTIAIQKWRGPVLYDLSYFIQRKDMLLRLAAILMETDTGSISPLFMEQTRYQMILAAHVRRCLSQGHTETAAESMETLAELERMLAAKWKEWVQLL